MTTHAEDAVLSYIVTDPTKGIPYCARQTGMPDFDCSPAETSQAIDSLRRNGLVKKNGPFYNLTPGGTVLMQPVIDQLNALIEPKRPRLYPTSRHTGWQIVYGLRTDQFGLGYESQSTLGCLDATTSMPAGSVVGVDDYSISNVRFVCERTTLRPGA